jgi:hypothetical protein
MWIRKFVFKSEKKINSLQKIILEIFTWIYKLIFHYKLFYLNLKLNYFKFKNYYLKLKTYFNLEFYIWILKIGNRSYKKEIIIIK